MTKVKINVNNMDYFVKDNASVIDILKACGATPTEDYILEHSVYIKNDNHICLWQWQWQSIVDHTMSPIPNDSIFRCMHKKGTLEV